MMTSLSEKESKDRINLIIWNKRIELDEKRKREERRRKSLYGASTKAWVKLLSRKSLNQFVHLTKLTEVNTIEGEKSKLQKSLFATANEALLKKTRSEFIDKYGDTIQQEYDHKIYEEERTRFAIRCMRTKSKVGSTVEIFKKTYDEVIHCHTVEKVSVNTVTENFGHCMQIEELDTYTIRDFRNNIGEWTVAPYISDRLIILPHAVSFKKRFAYDWLKDNIGQTITCFTKTEFEGYEKLTFTVCELTEEGIEDNPGCDHLVQLKHNDVNVCFSFYLKDRYVEGKARFIISGLGIKRGSYEWLYTEWGYLYVNTVNTMSEVLKKRTRFGSYASDFLKHVMSFL